MSSLKNTINKFKSKNILVVGDLILDQHIQGQVTRISPEAPVPIVLQEGEPTFAPGGAANVATNLKSLGANVTLVGQIGNDVEGQIFLKELRKRKISTHGVFSSKTKPTIFKTRIIARHQQVLRLDREKAEDKNHPQLTKKILKYIENHINAIDAFIISDYGKGIVTAPLLTALCQLAQKKKKIITVDPKDDHFGYYKGVTAITPNRKEAENAIRNLIITHSDRGQIKLTSDRLKTEKDIRTAGAELLKFLNLDSILITVGETGMFLFEKGKAPFHIHTRAQDVFDVTGAGDTVISVFTLSLSAGATKRQAADLANYAAGVVVGKMGTATVSKQELIKAAELQ